MRNRWPGVSLVVLFAFVALAFAVTPQMARAQTGDQGQSGDAVAIEDEAPPLLTPEELDILVARIALYPDELVGLITASSLYPLQIVDAARMLDTAGPDGRIEPRPTWDGSVISLLNYPDILKMMSDDLMWTEQLGNAVADQEGDVLAAVQRLRQKAVDDGVIATDDKARVAREDGNIIIEPVHAEQIYVPQYPPQMLYEPDYLPAPITYYPEPYPSYYNPTAPFFAAAITGIVWAAVIDWNDRDIWGGRWRGGNNIYINCRDCFKGRRYNGRVRWSDVDWRRVDRRRITIDRNQYRRLDRRQLRRGITSDANNRLDRRARDVRQQRRAQQYRSNTGSGATRPAFDANRKPGNRDKVRVRGGNQDLFTSPAPMDNRKIDKARRPKTDANKARVRPEKPRQPQVQPRKQHNQPNAQQRVRPQDLQRNRANDRQRARPNDWQRNPTATRQRARPNTQQRNQPRARQNNRNDRSQTRQRNSRQREFH